MLNENGTLDSGINDATATLATLARLGRGEVAARARLGFGLEITGEATRALLRLGTTCGMLSSAAERARARLGRIGH